MENCIMYCLVDNKWNRIWSFDYSMSDAEKALAQQNDPGFYRIELVQSKNYFDESGRPVKLDFVKDPELVQELDPANEDLDDQLHNVVSEMLPFVKPSDVIKEAAAASSNNFHMIPEFWDQMQDYYKKLVLSKRPDDDIEDHMLLKYSIQALRPMMSKMLQIYMLYIDFDVPDLIIFEIDSQLKQLEKTPAAGRWWFHDDDKWEYMRDYPEETAEYLMYVYYRQLLNYLKGSVTLSGREFKHPDIRDLKDDFVYFDDSEMSWMI